MLKLWIHPFFRSHISFKFIDETLNSVICFLCLNRTDTVSVIITTNRRIKSLNNKYRNINEVTDVLAFNQDCRMEDGSVFLGEIIIAFPRLLKQARTKKVNFRNELRLLLVHGLLHLTGFDHATAKDKKEMWSLQANILTTLGVKTESLALGDDVSD